MLRLFTIASVVFLFACGSSERGGAELKSEDKNNRDTLISQIHALEQKINASKALDYNLGASMVAAYQDFYLHYPKDANSADYLFKAGDISMNLKQSAKAVELFKTVFESYPNYSKTPFALFLEGFVYENQMHDLKQAKQVYELVIRLYPNSKVAEDAKASIANLGKSDQELIQEFEKKNKAK